VGDCLFARALELAASYTTNEVCRKISTATKTVCAGEVLQTRERFNLDLSRGQYLRIVEMKTGALFAVSCELGASLSGASGTAAQALRDYGLALGIAYQIYDDCVDIFGDEPQAGKSLGTDLETGKLTLPSLLYLQEASDEERRQLRTLLLGNGAVNRRQLAALLQKRHALQQSVALIQSCTERAAQSLAGLSASECLTSLNQLASFLHRQSDAVGG
jgi:octaprenyl-diphosphate synthase